MQQKRQEEWEAIDGAEKESGEPLLLRLPAARAPAWRRQSEGSAAQGSAAAPRGRGQVGGWNMQAGGRGVT